MYSIEYKWTKNEIEVTTINITAVKVSNKKPHWDLKRSASNQDFKKITHLLEFKPTS